MNNIFDHPISQFIIGGTILAGASYCANNVSPFMASVLVTVPLELLTLFFIHKETKLKSFALNAITMSIATIFPVLFYFIIRPYNFINTNVEKIASLIFWIFTTFMVYKFQQYYYK